MSSRGKSVIGGNLFLGLVIIALGIIFLVGNIYPEINIWRLIGRFWPIVLIALGISIIYSRGRRWGSISPGYINHEKMFGDTRLNYSGNEIGETGASQVIGDLSIDLRGSRLKPGVNSLSISSVIGDTTLFVPASFALKFSGRTVIGDLKIDGQIEQGIMPRIEHLDETFNKANEKLQVVFNGVIGDMTLIKV